MSIFIIDNANIYKTKTGYSIGVGKEYKTEQQLLQEFHISTNLEQQKKLSLVINDNEIIYDKWNSKYELTLGVLCTWLQETANKVDNSCGIPIDMRMCNPLYRYLERLARQNAKLDNSGNMKLKIYTDQDSDEYKSPAEFIRYVQYYCSLRHCSVKEIFDEKVLLVELNGNIIFNGLTDGPLTTGDLYDFFVNGQWNSTSVYEDRRTERSTVYNHSHDVFSSLSGKKADNPKGVTQDYATYYTIFRGKK